MNRSNVVAACLFTAVFVSAFAAGDNHGLYFNAVGLLIVLSGTLGATFLSYPSADIAAALRVARNSYTQAPPTEIEIIDTLMDLSVRSRSNGLLALEEAEDETTVSFLRNALVMMVDGYTEEELREVLVTEMYYFKQRRDQHERLFRHLARLAPAFGVAGSVVGLIGMLGGIGDMQVMLATIPIALTSTLYGIVLANFLLTPVAESIGAKTQKELLMQKLVCDGVLAIRRERNSQKLANKLAAFLTPSARPDSGRSLREIRERYRAMQRGARAPLPHGGRA